MMRLPKFTYRAPQTVSDAVRMIADAGPQGMFVAGGTDLYPNMNRRQQTPKTVITVMRLREMHAISGDEKSGMTIGAGVLLSEICEHRLLQALYPVVPLAAKTISTPLLRNMGTIGGNLLLDTRCNYYDQNYEWRKGINFCMKKDGDVCWVAPGSPKCWAVQSSDLAPVMVALGARFKFVSIDGDRIVEADQLYNNDGINYLNKRPNEMLTEIQLPPMNGKLATYQKLRRRGSFDFPVLGVAAAIDMSADGTIEKARIVLGGIAPAPIEVGEAETALTGQPFNADRIAEAAEACYLKARPLDNTDFVMGWRKQMARPFTIQALRALWLQSKSGTGI